MDCNDQVRGFLLSKNPKSTRLQQRSSIQFYYMSLHIMLGTYCERIKRRSFVNASKSLGSKSKFESMLVKRIVTMKFESKIWVFSN
jgi:hypothetical protein